MKRIIVTVLMFAFSTAASGNAYETGKITDIVPEGNAFVSVKLDGVDDVSLCSGGHRWTINTADPLFKEKYALLLTASVTGKSITLMHAESSNCGNWNSNQIYFIGYRPSE